MANQHFTAVTVDHIPVATSRSHLICIKFVSLPEAALLSLHDGCTFLSTQRAELFKDAALGGSVGCAIRLETRRSRVQPPPSRQHSFVEIDHEIFSTVILSLPLIQKGQLSVSGERMCTILVNRLED